MVEFDKGLTFAEECRDPDAIHGDVDQADYDEEGPFNQPDFSFVDHDQADSISDNLEEELGLDCPEGYCGKVIRKTMSIIVSTFRE